MTHKEWDTIFNIIKKEYAHKPSIAIISWKRREKLGFHVREHSQWVENKDFQAELFKYESRIAQPGINDLFNLAPTKGNTEHVICLDFYDEAKRTMFLLKYGEHIKSEHKWNR